MDHSPNDPSWWRWVVQKLVSHEQRITRLEEEDGDTEVTGFWSWANEATSTSQKLVGTVTFLIIVVLLILILASNDISIPYLSGKVPFVAITGQGMRLLPKLVYSNDVHKPDPGKAQKHDHDRI